MVHARAGLALFPRCSAQACTAPYPAVFEGSQLPLGVSFVVQMFAPQGLIPFAQPQQSAIANATLALLLPVLGAPMLFATPTLALPLPVLGIPTLLDPLCSRCSCPCSVRITLFATFATYSAPLLELSVVAGQNILPCMERHTSLPQAP